MVFNNKQGKKIKEILNQNMKMYECDIKQICMYNPLFCKTTKGNKKREQFFKEYGKGETIENLVKKYGLKFSINKGIITQYIPYKLKRMIFEIIRG